MPVLLTTGFSSSAQDAVRQGFEVLQKPYDIAALERGVTAVRNWADRPRRPESQHAAVTSSSAFRSRRGGEDAASSAIDHAEAPRRAPERA